MSLVLRASPLVLLLLAAHACGGSTGSSSAGDGGGADGGGGGSDGGSSPPVSRAYVHSKMAAGAGPNASTICGVTDPAWVDIGTATTSTNDGDNDPTSGLTVHVSCSVTANNDGTFKVSAIGTLGNKGSLTIVGNFTSGQSDTVMGVKGIFQRGDFGHFEDDNCTVVYASLDPNFTLVANAFAGVAAGRVWGVIDCPNAADSTQQRTGADGGPTARSCDGIAEFKFENCVQ